MKYPTISVIAPTLNSARTLEASLKSIREQNYPQENIEIILVDGGSTDTTKQIAKKFNARFVNGGYKENQEPRRGVGLKLAKNELVGVIDSDNILPHKNWLKKMVKPFNDNRVTCTEVWRYGLKEGFSLYNRYCALFGVNDTVAFYLKKFDKISWIYNHWPVGEILEDNKDYTVVRFTEQNLPPLGCNGFFVRTEILRKAKCDPDNYFHIDVVMDILRLGYDTVAMVKDEIYHDTAAKISTLASKRVKYFKTHNPNDVNRRYLMLNMKYPPDVVRLALFIFFTITLVQPILLSLYGFIKKPNLAWFLHPILCWIFLIAYTQSTLVVLKNKILKN